MTNPSLYRDDSRVRHKLDAMERIAELSRGLEREQLRRHENTRQGLRRVNRAASSLRYRISSPRPHIGARRAAPAEVRGPFGVCMRCRR